MSRQTSDAWLAAFVWQLWLNTWLPPPWWKHHTSSKTQSAWRSCSEPAVTLLNRRFFFFHAPYLRANPPHLPRSNFLHYMPPCTAPGTRPHSRTHRCVCSRRFSQSAPSPVTRGRVLFPQQSRIVCTHTTSCITAINHVEEITISTRQLQRAVERSNWILLIFPPAPVIGPGVETPSAANSPGGVR